MKYFLRVFLFNTFALWLTSQILPAVELPNAWLSILEVGFVLSLLMIIIKPILSILFIPINLMTFGLLSWAVNVIVIYLLTLIEPILRIVPFTFPGIAFEGFSIPVISVSYIWALVLATLSITFLSNVLHSISEHA